jgi:hypothetical protein
VMAGVAPQGLRNRALGVESDAPALGGLCPEDRVDRRNDFRLTILGEMSYSQCQTRDADS